jgi:hypothetical protein
VILTLAGAVRPNHPRARRELRFGFERAGQNLPEPDEVCLQLTTLVAK